jgi:hypothetical protein
MKEIFMEKRIPLIVERNRDVEHIMLAGARYGVHGHGKKNLGRLFTMLCVADVHQSYAQMDGKWTITSEYTPGLENTRLNYAALTSTQPAANGTLIISEVMADNVSYPAADGVVYDWIEIQNVGTSPVDLNGYSLSDNAAKPSQWKFPAVTLQPNGCIVVYASGLNSTDNGVLHANFGLRAEGESILLYNKNGQVLDHIEYDNLREDQSLKRQSDGSYSTSGTPSPGQAN